MTSLERDRDRQVEIHERWRKKKNRDQDSASYRDEWYAEQCGACRHWLPLAGEMGNDYGACTNARSPFDKQAMFEHDGCEYFEKDGEWM
jgi:hypothetical protein